MPPKIARPNRYSSTLAMSAAKATFQASCLRSLLEWPRVRLMKLRTGCEHEHFQVDAELMEHERGPAKGWRGLGCGGLRRQVRKCAPGLSRLRWLAQY